jgi:hypothetical protein
MFDSDGANIIFVAGAPGSKWSAIAHAVMYADGINTSDLNIERSHQTKSSALHFGNYFGPGMEFGEGFADLTAYSKSELMAEFSAPFQELCGVMILKSHLFSRHLPYLAKTFPKARFLLVHRSDQECLKWWTEAGGFSISFPDYAWYGNTARMAQQIALDNAGILAFAETRGIKLTRHRSMKPCLDALGLTYSMTNIKRVSELDFERRFGFGKLPLYTIKDTCNSMALCASIGVVKGK